MTPATYRFPTLRRGDTWQAWEIAQLTWQADSSPIGIASARLQIRTRDGALVQEWSTEAGTITISGAGANVLTLAALSRTATQSLKAGTHDYDLEVTTSAGETWTVLEGVAEIQTSITR